MNHTVWERSDACENSRLPVIQSLWVAVLVLAAGLSAAEPPARTPLDPRGKVHIPIGLANTVDTLKTFVEAEGSFSPGFGTYGIYFLMGGREDEEPMAPTREGIPCEHGLGAGGALIPWARWRVGDLEIKTEVCEVELSSPKGEVLVVGARAMLANLSQKPLTNRLGVVLRSLGPAGGPVNQLSVSPDGQALLVEGHPALVANEKPGKAVVIAEDLPNRLFQAESQGAEASSPNGAGSGALIFPVVLAPGETKTFGLICPVLPGRRAVGHRWDGVSGWAQFDLNQPNPPVGGELQPDPGLDYYRGLKAETLFAAAAAYGKTLQGRTAFALPDPRWAEAFAAIVGHAAMCMNEGAPDVAVVNYNVFNRDGMYVANIFQKSANFELAAAAIDYFLGHPFNGRVQPEADNPGQILWVMGEHWQFTRDRAWLARVYPAVQKIAAMIRYYRATPGPHWVWDTSLDFGEALPKNQRKELKPGACDGHNPAYTEAYDLAGLRAAVGLAEAMGRADEAAAWRQLAGTLFEVYEGKFSANLAKGYGSYAVLWPCRLYPFHQGKACDQFKPVGAQKPAGWRYFPLAKAHQGLLAGNREAGWKTLELHLAHPQMQGWYAFDEGGDSGTGGWNHVRTTWRQGKASIAMPHGWAIAEFHLLLRDCLLFEDGRRLVLLGGVPPQWFSHPMGMRLENLPTHFGNLSIEYRVRENQATLNLRGPAAPPEGFVLRWPKTVKAAFAIDGKGASLAENGDLSLPSGVKQVVIGLGEVVDELKR